MKRVWLNKALVKGKLAVSAQDRGLTLGDGVFETLAVTKGVALWRFEHIERMRKAAAELGIPFPEEEIENAIDALTHRAKDSHVLRLTLTRGEGGRGLAGDIAKPTLIGSLQPFDDKLRLQALDAHDINREAQLACTIVAFENTVLHRQYFCRTGSPCCGC